MCAGGVGHRQQGGALGALGGVVGVQLLAMCRTRTTALVVVCSRMPVVLCAWADTAGALKGYTDCPTCVSFWALKV